MYCCTCGHELLPTDKFCGECGSKVEIQPVTVILTTGVPANLYLYGGLYFYDKLCKQACPKDIICKESQNNLFFFMK